MSNIQDIHIAIADTLSRIRVPIDRNTNRTQIMWDLRSRAKECDIIGETTLRTRYSNSWRELATDSEASRAPKYLTWIGRK